MAASFERDPQQTLTDAERRLSNLALLGQVSALDTDKARVRVTAGAITTGWLPFATLRAGPDRTWHAPEVGEQVIVICPNGDTNQGVVVGSIYRADYPAPADSADISRTEYKDEAFVQYDRNQHAWHLNVPTGGTITLEIGPSKIEMSDAGIKITGPRIDLN